MKYYHGSTHLFPVGFVLLPQQDRWICCQQVDNEQFLEKYRPQNKISRGKAVYLVISPDPDIIESAGGYSNYVYEVDPITRVEKSDLQWYTLINMYLDFDPDIIVLSQLNLTMKDTLIMYAKNYWRGIKHTDTDMSLFEFRTPAAKIIKQVKSQQPEGT